MCMAAVCSVGCEYQEAPRHWLFDINDYSGKLRGSTDWLAKLNVIVVVKRNIVERSTAVLLLLVLSSEDAATF